MTAYTISESSSVIKDIIDKLADGNTLKIEYKRCGEIHRIYVKLNENGDVVFNNNSADKWWKLIEFEPEHCAVLLNPSIKYSIVKGYVYNTAEAFDALFNKNAVITSECGKYHDNPEVYTYHLNSDVEYPVTAESTPAKITKNEYLGKWKIEYPEK